MSWRNLALACGAVVQFSSCHQAILTAPPGSTLTLFANPPFIPANGGVSVISALVIEPAGTPVPDGTVIQCFTSLGRVDEQSKTNDGVARFNLVSDSRSGIAVVTCVSGAPAAPGPAPSPSPDPSPTAPAPGGSGSGSIQVVIGTALPRVVIATADPATIEAADPRESTIVANVFDAAGNPVANVPIIFRIVPVSGSLPPDTERLESESNPRFTDNNGRALDVLRTHYPPGSPQKQVAVLASTPIAGVEDTVEVTIN
jgi:hypothetical protein